MREAVIVSTARTPIGRAYRGVFNNTDAPTMGGHVIKHAVSRAGVNSSEVEDVIMGCGMGQGWDGLSLYEGLGLGLLEMGDCWGLGAG